MIKIVTKILLLLMLSILVQSLMAQQPPLILKFDQNAPYQLRLLELKNGLKVIPGAKTMLFSVLLDQERYYPDRSLESSFAGGKMKFTMPDSIEISAEYVKKFEPGIKMIFRFTNRSLRDHTVENFVPLGEGNDRVYITAGGTKEWPDYLCRARLYRPGYGPVGVILPDNIWHAGFTDLKLNDTLSLTGFARRGQRDKEHTTIDRWAVTLKPGSWMEYEVYFDVHKGADWHDGLKMMFRDRYAFDLKSFDNSMFERSDLKWIRDSYLMLLQFAWDKEYYDQARGGYTFYQSISDYDDLTGGYDIFTLWPTWPRLGLDQRNQWDMYRDLPGGLKELSNQSDFMHKRGKKYFISYNPWDEGTRKEDQLKGMEDLLRATNADGVVLDTRGASSKELQAAADKVKPGIIMYSEGMAVIKDMPGIVSGRVHDALVLPPPLNLNKFIKPDFAIFRVLQLADDRLHREIAISFFNGYGVEINTMRPGRPSWMREEYEYLGIALKILRENSSVFHQYNWMPLIPSLADSIYVNYWNNGGKTLYTIYSGLPKGHDGPLFEVPAVPENMHFIDLWNHEEIQPVTKENKILVPVKIGAFDPSWLHTRREGNAGCIARFEKLLEIRQEGGILAFSGFSGDRIVVTEGNPIYSSTSRLYGIQGGEINVYDVFEPSAEKIVVQLFNQSELLDERIIHLANNKPLLISKTERTPVPPDVPAGMKEIPAGLFSFYTKRDSSSQEPFIPLPVHSDTVKIKMPRFYMDIFPVTNYEFQKFVKTSNYHPRDTTNFLKHWINGKIPDGKENYPVVYVSPEDAMAYARWAGKRLPTEEEWQYAAQGTDMRKYTWGNKMDSTRCNYNRNYITPVNAFENGASPFGIKDMIGNVWQMTGDVYDIGCYRYLIIRGGSYYHPTQSIWYVTGGPLPADHPEILLLIAPGLDRNATVGFRCVADTD